MFHEAHVEPNRLSSARHSLNLGLSGGFPMDFPLPIPSLLIIMALGSSDIPSSFISSTSTIYPPSLGAPKGLKGDITPHGQQTL